MGQKLDDHGDGNPQLLKFRFEVHEQARVVAADPSAIAGSSTSGSTAARVRGREIRRRRCMPKRTYERRLLAGTSHR